MILNILVVTKYKWKSRDAKHARIKNTFMQKGNGITDVKFTTLYKDVGTPEMYVDTLGKRRIREEWFEKNISIDAKMKGFNAVVFQFSTEDGKAWGIDAGHRGSNYRDKDFFGECWVKCNENSRRKYKKRRERDMYEVLVPHETGHELKNQGFTTLDMHNFDYRSEINKIEEFYKQIRITTEQEQISIKGRILDLRLILTMFNTLFGQNKSQLLYEKALQYIGTDASPLDRADDELGCAESVSEIICKVISSFKVVTGTWTLMNAFDTDDRFEELTFTNHDIVPVGTIIICATVPGKPFPGHVGIFAKNNSIMSNDSATGKFMANYTAETWYQRWVVKGGYRVRFYKLKN
jgi:hypothetical protein